MISLTIGNSTSKVTGLSMEQHKALRNILAFYPDPKLSRYSGFKGQAKRYLMDKAGNFPTGLTYLVKDFCKAKRIKLETYDFRIKPTTRLPLTPNLGFTPYSEQQRAATWAEVQTRGIICAPTGVGKSAIIALIIARLKVSTLVVVPTLELKKQLTTSLLEWFGEESKKYITVQNVDALDPAKPTKVDMVIIDEFHHSGAKSYRALNQKAWGGVYYKFGLTATPFRSQDHEKILLESVLAQVIYKIEYKTAVDRGYIVPMEAYYIDVPKSHPESTIWRGVYSELVVNNVTRNRLIGQLINHLASAKIKTLCLVKEIKHGETIETDTGCGFANGQSEDSPTLIAGFNQGKLTALVGTTGVLGEGVDTKPAEYIIIAGLGKSKNAFMQQVGRGFRNYPGKTSCKIIIFRDPSHRWTLAHFKEQCKILKDEYNVIPIKLEL